MSTQCCCSKLTANVRPSSVGMAVNQCNATRSLRLVQHLAVRQRQARLSNFLDKAFH